MGNLTQALAHIIKIGDQLRILIEAISLNDLDICFPAKFDLIRFTQEHQFLFTAYGLTAHEGSKKQDPSGKSQGGYLEIFFYHGIPPIHLENSKIFNTTSESESFVFVKSFL